MEGPANNISNETPVVVHVLFEDGTAGNPCDLFGCSTSAMGVNVDIEPEMRGVDRSTWLLFHNGEGNVTFSVQLDFGNSCEPLLLSTSYIYDSQPPSVQVNIDQGSMQDNTTLVIAFTFSETVRPLNRSAFEHNTQILRVERLTGVMTVVSLDAKPGQTTRIALLKSSYLDTAGNFGANDAVAEVETPVNLRLANVIEDTKTPMALVVGGGLAMSTVAAPAAAGGFTMRTNLVRASLHLQFLAMTANMAVPGLSEGYMDLAETFSWASFASKDPPWQENEKDGTAGSGRKLKASSPEDGKVVALRPRQNVTREESFDHFRETLIALGALLSGAVLLHLIVLKAFKCFDKEIPKMMTFPRLDIQLVMAANPPLAFSSCRLLSFGDPLAVGASAAVLLLLVAPFLFWFVRVLTLQNLILEPKIYFTKGEPERQGSLDDLLISPFEGQSSDADSEAKLVARENRVAPPPLQTQTPDLVAFLHEKQDTAVQDTGASAKSEPSLTLNSEEEAHVERLLATRPARVDSETGEITKSCPSTRSFPLPMPHSTLRLNPYRSAGRSATGSPLLTPPHHQRYGPIEAEEQVMLPGSDGSEAVAPPSWMGILPHNARYDDSDSDSENLEEIHEVSWRPPPSSLPPLPPSSSEKYNEFFRAQSSKRVRKSPEPIAEGARIQSTDSEACHAPLLDPSMRERTITDGLRSTVSLSALDFFSERDALIYGRSTSDPALGQKSVRDTASYLLPECNEEPASWCLLERQKGFIARYGFAFEDVLGADPEKGRSRATPQMLSTHAVFFVSRVLAAGVFGFWSRFRRSWVQVVILLVVHLFCVVHLLYLRPYAARSLQLVEGFVHIVESVIVLGAMVLLFSFQVEWVNCVMIGAFYCGALALGMFEFRRLIPLVKIIGGRIWAPSSRNRKRGEYVRETLE
ncbi:hypothetical protein BSKO_02107 [Bryopsis sp. KO-2023]|nr:hypothetical protein BSKO_02107 [Bryopsis sp. KO-2023]